MEKRGRLNRARALCSLLRFYTPHRAFFCGRLHFLSVLALTLGYLKKGLRESAVSFSSLPLFVVLFSAVSFLYSPEVFFVIGQMRAHRKIGPRKGLRGPFFYYLGVFLRT